MIDLAEAVSDLGRRLGRLILPGTVEEVSLERAQVRVRYSAPPDMAVTAWLPWLTARAGADRTWWAPSVGEGVLVLSPGGDPAVGFVLPAIYQADPRQAPAADADKHLVVYASGARVEHDGQARTFTLTTAGGKTVVVSDDGDVTAAGDLTAGGDVEAAGDVTDKGRSMASMRTIYNTHTHAPGSPPSQQM